VFQDAVNAGLIEINPFSKLNIEEKPGRRDHDPLTIDELERLADLSIDVHGPEYGPVMRAMILFTAKVGPRLNEACALEWPWIDYARSEVEFKVAKFDKPRTVLLLDEAADALRSMPRRADGHPHVFRAKRGGPLNARTTGCGTPSAPRSGPPCPRTAGGRLSTSTGTRSGTSAAGTSTSTSVSPTSWPRTSSAARTRS
jgi:integrase